MSTRLTVALVALLSLVACADAVVPTPDAGVARILLTPNRLELRSTEGWNIVATAVDAYGNALPDRIFTWESSNADAVVVAPDGWVRAVRPGTAVITARSGGKSATVPVTVSAFNDYELVFERVIQDRTELFITDLNGGAPRRLLPGVNAREPAVSPDGSKIAFVIIAYNIPDGAEGDVYVVNRDGTGLTRLTSAAGFEHQPAWSPTGTRLLFRAVPDGTGGDLWVMNADGSNAVNLTASAASERDPAFSHDGSRVAYTSNVTGGTEVWTMEADGSGKERLTFTGAYQARPTWSPDGKFLAFAQRLPGRTTDLAVISADGQDVVRIELPGDQESPAWSPESRLLAFASDHEGARSIYEFHLHSLDITRRTVSATNDASPTWARKQ